MERTLHSKMGIAVIIVGSVFLLTAGAALAASVAKTEPVKATASGTDFSPATLALSRTVAGTQPMTGGVMIPTCISLFFGETVTDVVAVRSEGLGWGEVAKVYFFATEGITEVNYVVDLRTGGMGWGQIAKYLDLSPGRHGNNLGCLVSGRCPITDTVPVAAQRLADRLGADAEDIAAMLEQEGVTNGTVIVAHKLAAQFPGQLPDETTPEDLVARRLAGESWGEIRRGLKNSANTTASGLSAPGGGNSNGQGKNGNQGHGKPEDKGNQGHGKGHDKDHGHGGGKKH